MSHISYLCKLGLVRIKLWWKFGQIVEVKILLEISQKITYVAKFENKPLHKEIKFILCSIWYLKLVSGVSLVEGSRK